MGCERMRMITRLEVARPPHSPACRTANTRPTSALQVGLKLLILRQSYCTATGMNIKHLCVPGLLFEVFNVRFFLMYSAVDLSVLSVVFGIKRSNRLIFSFEDLFAVYSSLHGHVDIVPGAPWGLPPR